MDCPLDEYPKGDEREQTLPAVALATSESPATGGRGNCDGQSRGAEPRSCSLVGWRQRGWKDDRNSASAERFGIDFYSADTAIGIHSQLLASEAPLLERFRSMSVDERWVRHDPVTMYETFPWFHGEGFELLIEDLQQMSTNRLLLVEGFRLLPDLVAPHLANPNHAVWLLPTTEFRRAAFQRRRGTDAFWLGTTDPDRALMNLLERDRIFANRIADDTIRNGLNSLYVDGSKTADDIAKEIASRFGLQ